MLIWMDIGMLLVLGLISFKGSEKHFHEWTKRHRCTGTRAIVIGFIACLTVAAVWPLVVFNLIKSFKEICNK